MISLRGSVAPRLEPEIAFKLRAPVPVGCKDPATHIAGGRMARTEFRNRRLPFSELEIQVRRFGGGFVVSLAPGRRRPVPDRRRRSQHRSPRKSAIAKSTLSRNGEVRDRGVGSNALDHPALALAFLADILATQPQFAPLAAGEMITTGTLTAALPIVAGETWTSEISGLPVAPLTLTFGS